ncbi:MULTISPECIES: type II toxin-antitoxin system VapC family toxin [unclassified Rhizobium]|uniref:type II toxin-antitoxin system VapC family toxin n=1 Tax=unclassified Rhizobium TaxID=2613769 RepID=UPI000EA9FEBB|nr:MULTISPECIES: type II toxin-antitoxin system VapC family toxin [unclassified Rhizobium]AYG68719.1 type II toxin-antitoxin system VapC family toxin [Rhizobium sp. CCGE531]AYG75106.1 type II toxin-antitoxin system VapC family toxin [Rhizobium sp. CCGE532]
MVKALFDTNILIDHLNAIPQARRELMRYEEKAISIITWMEVLAGAKPTVIVGTRAFLTGFIVIAVDDHIAERAVYLRQQHRIKLPDAIIWATANVHSMLLVTRNTKDFPREMPDIRVPYEI